MLHACYDFLCNQVCCRPVQEDEYDEFLSVAAAPNPRLRLVVIVPLKQLQVSS